MRYTPIILTLFLCLHWLSPAHAKEWDPRLLQASDLAYQGQYRQAGNLVDQYIQDKPVDPNGYVLKAMVYDWERNLTSKPGEPLKKKTLKFHKKANQLAFHRWEKDPKNVDTLIDLGNTYIFLGRAYGDTGSWMRAVLTAKKARKHLEKAFAIDPNRVDGLVSLGVFHYVADNAPKGMAPFKALLGIKGSKTQGLAELNQALTQKHPFQNDALVALYFIHYEFEKNYPKALEYIAQLEKQFPDNPKWQMLRAEAFEKQDKAKGLQGYLQVVEWCQARTGQCDPKFPFFGYLNAGRLARDLGQNSQAVDLLTRSLPLAPPTEGHHQANALVWLGEMEAASGNPSSALAKFRQAQEVVGIQKDQKKKLKKQIESLCQGPSAPTSC